MRLRSLEIRDRSRTLLFGVMLAIGLGFLGVTPVSASSISVASIDEDDHAKQCCCGPKCRKETCCCGSGATAEPAPAPRSVEASTLGTSVKGFPCLRDAPCHDPAHPGSSPLSVPDKSPIVGGRASFSALPCSERLPIDVSTVSPILGQSPLERPPRPF